MQRGADAHARQPPFSTKYEVMWIEEFGRWRYVHRETGDVLENEPFY